MGRNIYVHLSLSNLCAIGSEFPNKCYIIQGTEEILIINLYLTGLEINRRCPNILIIILHLVRMRIEHPIGTNQTVAVKVIVRSRIATIVAAVGIDLLSFLIDIAQTLIDEIPDVSTLIVRILAD